MTCLSVENLSFSYENRLLLNKVSFVIKDKQIISLLGRSGCGKTTLFRILTGLSKPTSGVIQCSCSLSYMTQNTLLLPWRTVLENLLLLAELGKKTKESKSIIKEKAFFFLNEVGLKGSENKYPSEMSGGMQSRVALARALMEDTDLLLLDEPFAFLDAITRKECQSLLFSLKQKFSKSMILVTHDIEEAVLLSDRVLLLSNGNIENCWDNLGEVKDKKHLIKEIEQKL